MSKDSDFLNLLDRHGPPLKIIWVTCGNTSNRRFYVGHFGQPLRCSKAAKSS